MPSRFFVTLFARKEKAVTSGNLRNTLNRLTKPVILRGMASYLDGERIAGFRETPKAYWLTICNESLPMRHVLAIAARDGLDVVLTGATWAVVR